MTAKKKKDNAPTGLQDVESALTRTEQFIEDNQKVITWVVGAIVVLVAAFLGLKRYYFQPLEQEALSQMYVAEQYFERDSFNLAVQGDGNYLGFIDIIDEYKMTKVRNLARYYTGISFLHLGQYEEAIDYLKKFRSKDPVLMPVALGAIGDAMAELGNVEEAASWYLNAAEQSTNNFTTPVFLMKAGQLYEELGQYGKALELYERIELEYPESTEGRNVEKAITRAKIGSGQTP